MDIGGKDCGVSCYLTQHQTLEIKGWRTHSEGKAFRLATIAPQESEEGEDQDLGCMNEVVVRIYPSTLFRAAKSAKTAPAKPVTEQSDARILPEYRLRVPKDDTKKFFHRPSLACVEGTPFQVSTTKV